MSTLNEEDGLPSRFLDFCALGEHRRGIEQLSNPGQLRRGGVVISGLAACG